MNTKLELLVRAKAEAFEKFTGLYAKLVDAVAPGIPPTAVDEFMAQVDALYYELDTLEHAIERLMP